MGTNNHLNNIIKTSSRFEAERQYWSDKLQGDVVISSLPHNLSASLQKGSKLEEINYTFSDEMYSDIMRISNGGQLGTYLVLLSSVLTLLSSYRGETEIIVGMPLLSQQSEEVEGLTDFLLIKNIFHKADSFRSVLMNLKKEVIKTNEFQNIPFSFIADFLEGSKNEEDNYGLIKTVVLLEGLHETEKLSQLAPDNVFKFVAKENTLQLICSYNSELFTREYIKKAIIHLENYLTGLLKNTDESIYNIQFLSEEEMLQLEEWSFSSNIEYEDVQGLHQLFEEQCQKTPHQKALIAREIELTYQELNERANQLAYKLLEKGIGAGKIVAILDEDPIMVFIALLGILKAGGAFLPIDPVYPEDRIIYMLEDSEAQLMVSSNNGYGRLAKGDFLLLTHEKDPSRETSNPAINNTPKDLAYIIYTSGTTGRPKGVLTTHENIINRTFWRRGEYQLSTKDTTLQLYSVAFDGYQISAFTPIVSGATVVVLRNEEVKNPIVIRDAIHQHKITHFTCVPPLFKTLLTCLEKEDCYSLRLVSLAGDKITEDILSMCEEKFPWIEIMNVYGPTEVTVETTIDRNLKSSEVITVGRPVANTTVYIVNSFGQLVPSEVPGELWASGVGVSLGYLKNPELTKEKFIDNPFKEGERIYKSGDLVKWLPDGRVYFIGRIDQQVKIRGYRIELGEIESRLKIIPSIKDAVVLVGENANQQKNIYGFVEIRENFNVNMVKDTLKKDIPPYMIPIIIPIEKIPLTGNGKIDNKKLLTIAKREEVEEVYVAPTNQLQEKLVHIWQEVLNISQVGIHNDFFAVGGDSLKVMLLISILNKEFNVVLYITEIFKAPTIAELEEVILSKKKEETVSIEKVPEGEYYEISSAQKRIYTVCSQNVGVSYNIPFAVMIEGNLNVKKMENAFKKIVERHEAFRTSFFMVDETIVQKIHPSVEFKLSYNELTLEDEKQENTLIDEAIERFIRPFDLSKAPLLRANLLKVADNKHILMLDFHHIISDGESTSILIKELVSFYNEEELLPLKIQYKDFAHWQNKLKDSKVIAEQEKYWLKVYEEEVPVLNLPTDYPRPTLMSFEGEYITFELDGDLLGVLEEIGRKNGATLFMVLLSAYYILLSKYTGQTDIIVGSVIAGRSHGDLKNIMGMFVNTLALRNRPSGEKTFYEFLEEVKEHAINAYKNQDYQFETLLEKLDIKKELNRNPLFDTLFALQNIEKLQVESDVLKFTKYPMAKGVAKFDLMINASKNKEGKLEFELEYRSQLFARESMEAFGRHFINILKVICFNPEIRLADIEMLNPGEKYLIMEAYNETAVTNEELRKTVVELFQEQVEKTPDKAAIIDEIGTLTYKELNLQSNALARTLRKKGVKAETLVAIMMKPSRHFLISLWAVLKAGGAYLPIDESHPQDRVKYMLEDSGTQVLLCFGDSVDGIGNIEVIDTRIEGNYHQDTTNLMVTNEMNHLVYVIYTSGSTGKPKGVMIEHGGLTNYINFAIKTYAKGERANFPLYTSISFDLTVTSIFTPLLTGNSVILYEDIGREFIIEKVMKDERIDIIKITPAHLKLVKELDKISTSIKRFIVGGEQLETDLTKEIQKMLGESIEIYNEYGPTETVVGCMIHLYNQELDKGRAVPIGIPIDNTQIYLLDQYLKPVATNVEAEIYIGGAGVARGYINKENLTGEKFVENPYKKGERLYKTGDLGKRLNDGKLVFIGRGDNQVKVRGYRIELEEIEFQIRKLPFIKEVIVTTIEAVTGEKHLCGYLICEEKATLDVEEIKVELSKELPEYMIPTHLIVIEEIPLTSNGKVDTKSLPNPFKQHVEREYIAPRDRTEEILVEVWKKVLGIEKISITDNFFELGGDSIKAIQVASRLRNYQLKMEVKQLFEYLTIRDISSKIEVVVNISEQGAVTGEIQPTPIQHWLMEGGFNKIQHYNQSIMLFSKVGFEVAYVKTAFDKLVFHHDALRMVYLNEDEGIKQINRGIEERLYNLYVFDYRGIKDYESMIFNEAEKLQASINLQEGPLVKLAIFKTDEGDYLLIIVHHLVVDGVSWRILSEDLSALYMGIVNGEEIELPLKTDSYKKWSETLLKYAENKKLLKEIDYWREVENTKVASLPVDETTANNLYKDTERIEIELSAEETDNLLREANQAYNTRTNDLLIVALSNAIHQWRGEKKIIINLEGHGREEIDKNVDISRTVGWFTTIYPVVLEMKKPEDMSYQIKFIKETLRQVPNNGIGYGILKYLTPKGKLGNLEFNINRDVSFNYLGQFGNDLDNGVFGISKLSTGSQISPEGERYFNLDIIGKIMEDKLLIVIEYNKNQYHAETIEKLGGMYKDNLVAIIQHCLNKSEKEITAADVGGEGVSLEEFDEIAEFYSNL